MLVWWDRFHPMDLERAKDDVVRGQAVYDVESCQQIDFFGEGLQGNLTDGLLRFSIKSDQGC